MQFTSVQPFFVCIISKKRENLQIRGENLEMKFEQRTRALTVTLPAEIDHHSARPIREEADMWITKLRPETVVLDFSGVKFMDSSGIGLILGRYNKVAPIGGRVIVECADRRTLQLLRLAGVQKLVEIKSAAQV